MAKFTKSMSFVRNENYNHNLNVITERINSLEKAIADFKFNVAVQIDNHSDLIIKNRERITKLEKMANTTSATVDCDKFNLVSENMRLKEENKKLREENIKLKQSQNSASNEEINRMIDSTINIMKAWKMQREGAK